MSPANAVERRRKERGPKLSDVSLYMPPGRRHHDANLKRELLK